MFRITVWVIGEDPEFMLSEFTPYANGGFLIIALSDRDKMYDLEEVMQYTVSRF